MAVNLWVDEVL